MAPLSHRQMTWVPVMAIVLLAAGCPWNLSVAPLPAPGAPASSVRQIAERLGGHVAELPFAAHPGPRRLSIELASACSSRPTPNRATPPQDAPGYTALLRVAEVAAPIYVRVWLTSPEKAGKLLEQVGQVSTHCRPVAAAPFTHSGWNGIEVAVTNPTSTDNGDPVTFAAVVAHRGGLVAEVSWEWGVRSYEDVDRGRLEQIVAAARTVLRAVGGDPARH